MFTCSSSTAPCTPLGLDEEDAVGILAQSTRKPKHEIVLLLADDNQRLIALAELVVLGTLVKQQARHYAT